MIRDIGEWQDFTAAHGGRMTRQRKLLYSIILDNPNLTVQETRVSSATVCRTVRQLEKAGLLRERGIALI